MERKVLAATGTQHKRIRVASNHKPTAAVAAPHPAVAIRTEHVALAGERAVIHRHNAPPLLEVVVVDQVAGLRGVIPVLPHLDVVEENLAVESSGADKAIAQQHERRDVRKVMVNKRNTRP